jgi:hypothetical protein
MVKPAHGWDTFNYSIILKFCFMNNDENKDKKINDKKAEDSKVTPSSVDSKNEAVVHGTPSATDRVKPRAGDGLANEGTIVSYDRER